MKEQFRREFLMAAGGLAAVSGCLGGSEEDRDFVGLDSTDIDVSLDRNSLPDVSYTGVEVKPAFRISNFGGYWEGDSELYFLEQDKAIEKLESWDLELENGNRIILTHEFEPEDSGILHITAYDDEFRRKDSFYAPLRVSGSEI